MLVVAFVGIANAIDGGAAGARNRVRCWRRHRRPLCDAEDVTASTAEIRPARSRPVYRGVSSEKRVILSEKRVRPAPRRLLDGGHVLTELPRGRRFELALRDLVE